MQISVAVFVSILVVLVLLACLAGAACWQTGRYRSRLRAIDPDDREVYVSYASPDFTASAGFCLEGLPDTGILTPQAYWLIDGCIAEVEYNIVPAQRACLRLARSGCLRCADAFLDAVYDSTTTYEVDGIQVVQRQSAAGPVSISWSRGGYDFLFYAPHVQMNAMSGCVEAFIRQMPVREENA